jgi:hypothetical protein
VTADLPLPTGKDATAESVFQPANLLREARRQRNLPDEPVPRVCLLDPDGDIAAHLADTATEPIGEDRLAALTRLVAQPG